MTLVIHFAWSNNFYSNFLCGIFMSDLSVRSDVGERDLRLINIYFEFRKIHSSRNLQNDQVTRNN